MRKRPLLIIKWEDITSLRSWVDEGGDYTKEGLMCHSVGWKLKSNKKNLVISSCRSGETKQCSDRQIIPQGCIRNIRRLE